MVAIIYENRPNVTSDAAGLCLKSGNAAFLRGSSGAITSNQAIAAVLREAYEKADLPADALVLVDDTTLITGSFNFSKNAQSDNDENLLVIKNAPAIVAAYLAEYARVMAASTPERPAAEEPQE